MIIFEGSEHPDTPAALWLYTPVESVPKVHCGKVLQDGARALTMPYASCEGAQVIHVEGESLPK